MTATLEHRPFGRTGKHVSVIGLGCGCLHQQSHAQGVATVRRALELGVSYFETSPMYCNRFSQNIVGEAFEGRNESYLLATKLGYLSERADYRSKAALFAQLEDNLRRLRRPQVDVLLIHEADWTCWWNDNDPVGQPLQPGRTYDFANAPVIEVLHEARQRGLCRYVGVTGNNADLIATVIDCLDIDAVLVAFNYDLVFRTSRRSALPMARRKNVAFITGGLSRAGILNKVHPEWLMAPPAWMTPAVKQSIERIYELQKSCGLSLMAMAIRYVIADPSVATVLVGAATPADIEESVAAAQDGPLPAELHQAIDGLGISEAQERESRRPWGRCFLPDERPQEIAELQPT